MKNIIKYLGVVFMILTSVISVYSITENDNNVRAYYNLTGLGDASGRTGTLSNGVGTPSVITGIIGNGKDFTGGTQDELTQVNNPTPSYPLSFNAWVYQDSAVPFSAVAGVGDDTTFVRQIFLGVHNGYPIALSRNSAQVQAQATTSINGTGWNMITAVYPSDSLRMIYVNGVNEANETTTLSYPTGVNGLSIGMPHDSNTDQQFNGRIDEVSFWNKTLTQNDINQLYNSGFAFGWAFQLENPILTTNLSSKYSFGNFSVNFESSQQANITIYLDSVLLTTVNNINSTIYDFTNIANGFHNLSVYVENSNGYSWTNQTFEIQPNQYFRFYDNSIASYVTGYSFGGVDSIGQYVTLNTSILNVGNNLLSFFKDGYNSENFNIEFSNSAQLNESFNVSPTTLSLTVFNEFNPTEQLNFNVTIINSTDSTIYLNQVNFSISYNDAIKGNLTILVESSNYLSRNFYTSLTSTSSISQLLYLIPITDADQVIFRTISSIDSQPVTGSILNYYRYLNGSKVFLGQAETDGNGFTSFNLDSTKIYEVLLTSDGYVNQIFNTLPNTLTYTIILNPTGTLVDWLFNHFSYKFNPSGNTLNQIPLNFSVIYVDDQNLISNAIFTISGNDFETSTSSTMPSGTTLRIQINNISSNYFANLTVLRDGERYTFYKEYSYFNQSNYNTTIVNLSETLDGSANSEDRILVIIIGFVIFAVIGAWLGGASIGALTLFIPLILYAYVGWLPIGLSILMMVFIIMGVLVFQR